MANAHVVIGLSGGVDSAVAAARLLGAGYRLAAVTMKIWDGHTPAGEEGRHACYGPGEADDIADARRIAAQLGIRLHVLDLSADYRRRILDLCARQYLAGMTPNPCVHCNRMMKFDLIPARLRAMGIPCDYFATGHYAIIDHDPASGRHRLRRGADREKDQSYFLYQLTQEMLGRTLFPLGECTKDEIRDQARALGLPVAEKSESQDFIAGGYDTIFGAPARPGPILLEDGTVLGEHRGIQFYTIGQRRGLGIAYREPLYVVSIDEKRHAVIVGTVDRLSGTELAATGLNWIAIEDLHAPRRVTARIRYRHTPAAATVRPAGPDRVDVTFDEPQRAIAPGQAVVFYDGDVAIGGGIIAKG